MLGSGLRGGVLPSSHAALPERPLRLRRPSRTKMLSCTATDTGPSIKLGRGHIPSRAGTGAADFARDTVNTDAPPHIGRGIELERRGKVGYGFPTHETPLGFHPGRVFRKPRGFILRGAFAFLFPGHYAASRGFRHQRAGVSPYSLVRVSVRAGPITAVSGPAGCHLSSKFHMARAGGRAAPSWPAGRPLVDSLFAASQQ